MIRSTFSGFTMAQLALQFNQKGLDVAGQNTTNQKTPGYTRQRLDMMSLNLSGLTGFYTTGANPNIGFGVELTGVSQLRDKFLDIQYRDQSAKVATTDEVNHIQDLITDVYDETNKDAVHQQLSNVITAFSNYSTHVGDSEQESIVKSEMQSLINLFYRDHVDMQNIRTDLEPSEDGQSSMSVDIQKANDIIQNIAYVSKQITMSRTLGNPALEMLDKRNLLIDELSNYLPITVKYTDKVTATEPEEKSAFMDYITITLNDGDKDPNNDIVLLHESQYDIRVSDTADGKQELDPAGTKTLEDTIYFRQLGAEVMPEGAKNEDGDNIAGKTKFYVTGLPDPDNNTGGIIDQGIYTIKSKNIPTVFDSKKTADVNLYDVSGVQYGYNSNKALSAGKFKGTLDMLNKEGTFDGSDVNGLGFYDKSLDLMIDKYAKTLNSLNTPDGKNPNDFALFVSELDPGTKLDKDTTLADPVVLKKDDVIPAGTVLGEKVTINGRDYDKGDTIAADLTITDKIVKLPKGSKIKAGKELNAPITSSEGPFTAENIRISEDWRVGKIRLTATKEEDAGSMQNDNILAMMRALTEKRDFQYKVSSKDNTIESVNNGKSFFNGDFSEFYTNIGVTLGVDKRATDMLLETQESVKDTIAFNKDQVSGVDDNEETISMLQYNRAYRAAARVMTSMDEMLDILMNMGRVGR